MNARQQNRAARRLTYRSRSATVIAVLVALIAVLAWVGTEAVLAALGRPALLVAPSDAAAWLSSGDPLVAVGASVIAALGVALIITALVPARRGRRRLTDERSVIVIDDVVLAGAISRAAASAARVPSSQVSTALTRRAARVTISPTSGFDVPTDDVSGAVAEVLTAASTTRPIAQRIDVSPTGVLA